MDRIKTIILVLFLALVPGISHGAELIFSVPETSLAVGDTITLDVRLDTQGDSINTVDLGILYPGILSVKGISKAGSFVQIWVREPGYSNSVIFLSGGLPGGITSGNALIAKITLEAKSVGEGALGLSPASTVLLNDGSGTAATVGLRTPVIKVIPRKSSETSRTITSSPQIKQDKKDSKKPSSFNLEIGSDARLFGGKHFVSFFATDSDSGVDKYELKEGSGPFVLARSPFVLSDQDLHSVIRVRAYDTEGNYREEVYPNFLIRIWWRVISLFD